MKDISEVLLGSSLLLAIISALLYFWGYIYYESLVTFMGFSISFFNINKNDFLMAGSVELSLTILILFLIIFTIILSIAFFLIIHFLIKKIKISQKIEKKLNINQCTTFIKIEKFLNNNLNNDLVEKFFRIFACVILFIIINFILSCHAYHRALKTYKNLKYKAKDAIICFKNGKTKQMKYVMNIGDKIICLADKSFIAINEKTVESIKVLINKKN